MIGSKSVAEKVKKVGGDAVIVAGASSQIAGIATNANALASESSVFGNAFSRTINRTTTQLIVIKYLDPPAQ